MTTGELGCSRQNEIRAVGVNAFSRKRTLKAPLFSALWRFHVYYKLPVHVMFISELSIPGKPDYDKYVKKQKQSTVLYIEPKVLN